MTILLSALAVIAAVVFACWQNYRHNARLTGEMIALLGAHKTWVFSATDVAAGIKISVEKAQKLIDALPADLRRYAFVEGGIRYWGAHWSERLDIELEDQVLAYATANHGQTITVEALVEVLHNPEKVVRTVLQNLTDNPGANGHLYHITDTYGSILVPSAKAGLL